MTAITLFYFYYFTSLFVYYFYMTVLSLYFVFFTLFYNHKRSSRVYTQILLRLGVLSAFVQFTARSPSSSTEFCSTEHTFTNSSLSRQFWCPIFTNLTHKQNNNKRWKVLKQFKLAHIWRATTEIQTLRCQLTEQPLSCLAICQFVYVLNKQVECE